MSNMSFSFGTPKTTIQNSMFTMTTSANGSTQASADFFSRSNTQPTSTGFSLSGTTQASTGFSLGITNQPSTGFSFRTTSTSTGFSSSTTQVFNAFSLGTNQTSTTFSLGATPTVSSGFSLASTTQASTTFSLGTSPAVSSGFSLGSTSNSGFSLKSFGTTTSQASTLQTTAATTTQSPLVTSQSDTKFSAVQPTNFQQLNDLTNNLTVSFENQEKQFPNQVNEIAFWNNILTNQSTKLVKLEDILKQKEKEQAVIRNELDFLYSQQKRLDDFLIPLEQELQSAEVLSSLNNEREPIYKTAQEIDDQIKQMSRHIKEIESTLNKVNSKKDSDDDLDTFCRILNCHMTTIEYMEQNAENLSPRVSEVNEEHSRFLTAANDNCFLSSFRK